MEKILKYLGIVICLFILHSTWAPCADATPTLFAGTGNYYEFILVSDPFVGTNNYWMTAKDAAASLQYNGVYGHLATITSEEENDFIRDTAGFGIAMDFMGAWWRESSYRMVSGAGDWTGLHLHELGRFGAQQ